MITKVFLGVSALVLAAFTAQAVEDGIGTNVVRNLRVNDGGTLTLGGTAITNWSSMPVGTGAVSLADYLATNAVMSSATNVLNTRVNTDLANATNDLSSATNALNTRVNVDLANATNDLSNATNALNSRVNTDLANATNELYTIVNDLETHTNIWNNGVVINKGNDPTPALVPGQVYYLGAGSVWTKANASANSTAKGLIGLALGTTVADGLLLNGQFSSNQAYSVGAPLYLATNDCAITATMPSLNNQVVRIVGYVIDANTIMFNPDRTYIEILAQ